MPPRERDHLDPVVDRVVEQRYVHALATVDRVREEHAQCGVDDLAERLIRRYAKELAIGGAVTGGAAAAPVVGMAVASAATGADLALGMGRLGEMIMALGIVYGHDTTTVEQRRVAVVTVMGLADGAAVGVSGLAARAGARGGVRILRRLPSGPVAAGAGLTRRTLTKLSTSRGPWSLAALVPYGIGAGVGAAGNVMLTRAVGRAAKEYFSAQAEGDPNGVHAVVVEVVDDEDTEIVD